MPNYEFSTPKIRAYVRQYDTTNPNSNINKLTMEAEWDLINQTYTYPNPSVAVMTTVDPGFPAPIMTETSLNTDAFVEICFRSDTLMEPSDSIVFTFPNIYSPKIIGKDTFSCAGNGTGDWGTGLCRPIPNPIAGGSHDVLYQLGGSTERAANTNHCGRIPYFTPPCVIGSIVEPVNLKVYINFKLTHTYTLPAIATTFVQYTMCNHQGVTAFINANTLEFNADAVYQIKMVIS